MTRKNVLEHLTEHYPDLTRSGKKLADYVFGHKHETQYMSITSLAEVCNVAEATVSRFCRGLGYDGYNEFKLALAIASGATVTDAALPQGGIKEDDSITVMAKKLFASETMALRESLALLDEGAVTRAVQYFCHARRVLCFGQGSSMVIAMEAWARFSAVASHFVSIQDTHMQMMAVSLCTSDDVVWYFSYSGATREIMDMLRLARMHGAKVVLVTHFVKSPAAALADVILLCGSKESPLQSGSVSAKMGQLFLIDVLYNEYYRKNSEFSVQNYEATVEAISMRLL